jgi:eukaryotic-like serine/threonine-protein kinase
VSPETLKPRTTPSALGRRGRYEVFAELARTRAEVSYLGVLRDATGASKLVVVREPRPEFLGDESFVAAFLNRGRLAARLSHPNIVRTIAVESDGGRPFLATDYDDGQPLEELIHRAAKRVVRMPLRMLLGICLDVLAALEYAHALTDFDGRPFGAVHQGVKPAQVLVTYEGQVQLWGFALANGDPGLEQRLDLFGVGAMLWEAIVGHPPPDAPGARVPRAAEAWPDVDPELAAIVDRAVSADPAAGYASAQALRQDLAQYVRTRNIALPGSRVLGASVSKLFADERNARHALIEPHLGPTARGQSTPIPAVAQGDGGTRTSEIEPSVHEVPEVSAAPWPEEAVPASSEAPSVLSLGPPPSAARSPRVMVVAVAGGLGALLAISVAWVDHLRPGGQTVAPTLPSVSAPVVAAPSGEPARSAHVVVIASPRAAQIYVDDVAVANPYVSDQPRDGTVHRLRVEAPGYERKTRMLTFGEDVDIEIALEPERAAPIVRRGVFVPPATSSASARPCEPPFIVDPVTGTKRWRLECL